MTKKYDYATLIKMPFDYEDVITDLHFEGMLLAEIAEDMKLMGLNGMSFTFSTLARFKLEKLKVFLRLCK